MLLCVIQIKINKYEPLEIRNIINQLFIVFIFHSCTIDVFLRYVRIKKFIFIRVGCGR